MNSDGKVENGPWSTVYCFCMDYKQLAQDLVAQAQKLGATESEVYLQYRDRFEVNIRQGEIETLTRAASKGLGLRLFVEGRLGFGYTSDFSPDTLENLVKKALALAKESTPDKNQGLPEDKMTELPELNLFDPYLAEVEDETKIKMARDMEKAAFAYDTQVNNTEESSYGDHVGTVIIANSRGLLSSYTATSVELSCTTVAEEQGCKQVGWWGSHKRFFKDLASPESIGEKAAQRTVRMLNARKVKTQKVPVVFDPLAGASFWQAIFGALNGDTVYKKASFLAGKLGDKVASDLVTLIDDGTLPGGLGSRPFDGEGVPTRRKIALEKGILKTYFYDTYTARKVGVSPTGNAVRNYSTTPAIGPTNFFLQAGSHTPEEIIASVKNGLYLIWMMGMGANLVTGDYSRGAYGIWIENGELAYPVHEITVAGNMEEMMKNITMVGNDLEFMGAMASPTFKVAEMTVSGR